MRGDSCLRPKSDRAKGVLEHFYFYAVRSFTSTLFGRATPSAAFLEEKQRLPPLPVYTRSENVLISPGHQGTRGLNEQQIHCAATRRNRGSAGYCGGRPIPYPLLPAGRRSGRE